MAPIIEVKNLAKRYLIRHEHGDYITLRDRLAHPIRSLKTKTSKPEEFWALSDVSFNVEAGEVLGIIGHNGAGKSTLLKILSRITPPTKGEAKLRGRVSSLLEVGTGFHPELSGRENIFLSGVILGMTRAEIAKKFDEIVSFSGVEKFLDTPVKYYSSGMAVRLGFAVAANLDSEVLIIDEVLAVGDDEFQKKCLGKMSDITKKQGRTILFVSHNMTAVNNLCNKGICLDSGSISIEGNISRVIDSYMSGGVSGINTEVAKIQRTRPDITKKAKLVDFKLINDQRTNPGNIDSTKPVEIELSIEAEQELRTGINIVIKDVEGIVIWIDSVSTQKRYFNFKKGLNKVRLLLNSLYLTAGSYRMDFALTVGGLENHDILNNFYSFSVPQLDPFNSGFSISNATSVYYVEHRWESAN